MIMIDRILIGVTLLSACILMILFLKFAWDNPREWLWAISKRDFYNFRDFAAKLQPEENRGLLSRTKKREKEQRGE